jgi:hypothetical protein
MRKQVVPKADLFSRRLTHIGLHPERLKPQHQAILEELRASCPSCASPTRCVADLAATEPTRILEEWDEYCPNAARLRILAALSMFGNNTA